MTGANGIGWHAPVNVDLREVRHFPPSPIGPQLLDEAETLTGLVAALADRFPDWECLTILDRAREERSLTLGALWARARAVQAAIVRTGLAPAAVATGAPPPVVEVGSEAIATVQYSSGSTGIPKGVLLAHRALLNNIRAVRDGLALTAADVSVNWIPLYHDMGLIDAFLMPLVI